MAANCRTSAGRTCSRSTGGRNPTAPPALVTSTHSSSSPSRSSRVTGGSTTKVRGIERPYPLPQRLRSHCRIRHQPPVRRCPLLLVPCPQHRRGVHGGHQLLRPPVDLPLQQRPARLTAPERGTEQRPARGGAENHDRRGP